MGQQDGSRGATARHEAVHALVEGRCAAPFGVLGIHAVDGDERPGRVVRAFLPWAAEVWVLRESGATTMARIHQDGVFEAVFSHETEFFAYRLGVRDHGGATHEIDDPYRFGPVLDDHDLGRIVRGEELRVHRFLGARTITHHGVAGTCFAVWAPHARNVNLMGSFNDWDGRRHPMRPRGATGIWELFLPGIGEGAVYKYEVRTRLGGLTGDKADPVGFAMELRPATASVVAHVAGYQWRDAAWMEARAGRRALAEPMSIYEVHLGSWRRKPDADPDAGRPGWLSYRELADELLPYVRDMGFTHVELLPITEHPLDKSWGYQTVGYFAPTSRFGSPDDFRHFVDRAHELGIGVILDWVPAHFPSDGHGLVFFDGTHLYEHADPRQGRHPDWGTVIYNYGRPAVRAFLVSSALFWLEEFHIDGLRVDAVASMLYLDYSRAEGAWLPNRFGGKENLEAIDFLKVLNDTVHAECPGALTFAEESTAWPRVSHPTSEGGLGFDMKWNMGWMNDTLEVMKADPIYRRHLYNKLTFSMLYAFSERFLLALSHDEVVHMKGSLYTKMPGDEWQKLANLRLLYGYEYAHPGKKLLFMGAELGQLREWSHERELDWHVLEKEPHAGLQRWVRELNRAHAAEPALHQVDFGPEGFEWIDCHDPDRTTLSFVRWSSDWKDCVVVACNFTPVPWEEYRLAVPHGGRYRVLLNSDEPRFGGGGVELPQVLEAAEGELHGRKWFLTLTLPPLAAVYLKKLPED